MIDEPITAEWVTGRATGDRAKSILEHAAAGVGYHIIQQGRENNQSYCLYAFRRAADSPIPEHLLLVTDPVLLHRLTQWQNGRVPDRPDHRGIKRAIPKQATPVLNVVKSRQLKLIKPTASMKKRANAQTGQH